MFYGCVRAQSRGPKDTLKCLYVKGLGSCCTLLMRHTLMLLSDFGTSFPWARSSTRESHAKMEKKKESCEREDAKIFMKLFVIGLHPIMYVLV